MPPAENDVDRECGKPWADHDDDGVQMLCPDPTETFCEHGHHFQDPEPCDGCWPEFGVIPPEVSDR